MKSTDIGATDIEEPQNRLGPIRLSAGIRPRNALTLFYSAMMIIVFITFLNLLQPFILHEHLGMATAIQGDFTGNLYVLTEIVSLALVIPLGILSDRIGRRPIMVGAFMFFALGLFLVPMADNRTMLVLFRLVAGIGVACGVIMIASLLADYPENSARGKMISINGVCTGLGIVLIASFGLAQLPEFFVGRGHAPIMAGRLTFWIAAAIAFVSGFIAWAGIKGGAGRDPVGSTIDARFTTHRFWRNQEKPEAASRLWCDVCLAWGFDCSGLFLFALARGRGYGSEHERG